jgi:Spy/CpxP family protein refolding chaperone
MWDATRTQGEGFHLKISQSRREKVSPEFLMKKIVITLFALASAVPLIAQLADPSPTDAGKTGAEPAQRQERRGLWDRLQLTDDQRTKLQQIREADRDNLRSARAQVRIARESLKAALLANPENVADVQTKATAVANALSTSSVQMALHLAKINQVLTPVQRVELVDARRHWMTRRWRRFGGDREGGPGQERRPWQRQNQAPQQTPSPAQG